MDSPVVFVVLIVAIIALAMIVPRWIRRSGESARTREDAALAASRIPDALEELGRTIVLDAPEPAVRGILDEIAAQDPRRFTVLRDGEYGIRFVEPDDALVRMTSLPEGTRIAVERVREYLGRPQTSESWAVLRERTASAAASRGIETSDGPAVHHLRDPATTTWRLDV